VRRYPRFDAGNPVQVLRGERPERDAGHSLLPPCCRCDNVSGATGRYSFTRLTEWTSIFNEKSTVSSGCRLRPVVLVERLRRRRPAADPPKRILVLLLSEMGSLVLARPMFSYLKSRYPNASIHVMVFEKNREVLDLLAVVPEGDVLTLNDRSIGAFASTAWASCAGCARSVSTWSSTASCSPGSAASSRTFPAHPCGSDSTRTPRKACTAAPISIAPPRPPRLVQSYRHIARQFLALAAALESGTCPVSKDAPSADSVEMPMFDIGPGERGEMEERLHADFPAIRGKKLVLVYPSGGILPIRAWPLEHYRRLCAALLGEGYAIGSSVCNPTVPTRKRSRTTAGAPFAST